MARAPAIAVVDIGKSNAKLTLVDRADRHAIASRVTANTVVRDASYPHYDVEKLWTWIIDGLREFAKVAAVDTISVTTHGACFALLAGDRLALPILDYEFAGPESVRAAYAQVRGDFGETLSPDLPNGLNAGRQFFWQSRGYPDEFAKVDAILPYPQYWAWRLCGAKATEATSLGCHTDLWNPRTGTFSHLSVDQGWDRLFPTLAKPWEVVGTILPEVARATGLAAGTRIVAGIHDSNASLLPHLLARMQPFSVLSTGTWMVVFAPGGNLERLDSKRDCLANVDAFGRAVPSSRFMAGREYEIVSGGAAVPSTADIVQVIADRTFALPAFAPGTGPYGEHDGRWATKDSLLGDPSALGPGARAAVASLYAALLTETCLELSGADGPAIVEGPFARNRLFLSALAQRVPRPLIARPDATGTTEGAALLAEGPDANRRDEPDPPAVEPLDIDLSAYVKEWRAWLS